VTSDGFTTYGYNANGSLTSRSTATSTSTFNYNPEGRLSEVVREGSIVARYDYDVFNRRVKKEVVAQGSVLPTTTYYLYSDEGLIGEYTATGEEQKAYGWKPHGTWGTDPVWQRSSHSPFSILHYSFFLTDHLGTPQKLITATGETVWSASYDTFGRATVEIGAVIANGVKQSIGGSAIENNLRFPGQYFDAETGFHNNWHRYYIPELGRYNRLDPIKDDRNWYGYGKSNPLVFLDFDGRQVGYLGAGFASVAYACAQPQYEIAQSKYFDSGDKFKHCWVSCRISKTCGAILTQMAGIMKESKDSYRRIRGQIGGGTGDWKDSFEDLIANQQCIGFESYLGSVGSWLGALCRESCEDCCLRKVGYDK
jgi:RHS repeat-associated protein